MNTIISSGCFDRLELGVDDLIAKYEEAKSLSIMQKTAVKMSDAGKTLNSAIEVSDAGQRILEPL